MNTNTSPAPPTHLLARRPAVVAGGGELSLSACLSASSPYFVEGYAWDLWVPRQPAHPTFEPGTRAYNATVRACLAAIAAPLPLPLSPPPPPPPPPPAVPAPARFICSLCGSGYTRKGDVKRHFLMVCVPRRGNPAGL